MNKIDKILKRPCHKACDRYGSSMGRRNVIGEPETLHLQRMSWVDGDYDTGGAYWGNSGGTAIYCAFSPDDTENDEPTMIFVRAKNLVEARQSVVESLNHNTEQDAEAEGWQIRL